MPYRPNVPLLLLSLAAFTGGLPGHALPQDFDFGGGEEEGEDVGGDDLEDVIAEESNDLPMLRLSHFSEVHRWNGVAPLRPPKGKKQPSAWKIVKRQPVPPRVLVSPTSEQSISSTVAIPEEGEYRVWLSYVAEPGKAHPVTLSMEGANQHQHRFGRIAIETRPGKELEKQHPIRFEEESLRIVPPAGSVVIWEYVDLELKAGATTLKLSSRTPKAKVDSLFLTASKVFSPSKSPVLGEGNLYRTYCRMRVPGGGTSDAVYSVTRHALTYHWRRIYKGKTEPLWYGSIGARDKMGFVGPDGSKEIPLGTWTRWVEITEDITNGPWARGGGPWATGFLGFSGAEEDEAEVQLAWYPHEGAVMRTIRPGILGSSAVCMVPLDGSAVPPFAEGDPELGDWGMRRREVLKRFETATEVHQRHFKWADEAVAALGLKDPQAPRHIQLFSPCGPAPAVREACLRMLAKLGLNPFYGYRKGDTEIARELGHEQIAFIGANDSQYLCWSHDPLDPTAERNFEASLRSIAKKTMPPVDPPAMTVKMGDEIGAVVGPDSINGLETCRRAFHDYLRERLKEAGKDASFLGVENIEELPYLGHLPENPGLFERRLYYHCSRFKFVLTAMYYGQIARAAERVFPKVYTYCNFSPHPPMFGQHMNGSDWFALTREGGANTAWGEGWASGGGWGFVGHEVVSYYAAWVECAARKGKLPSGFYIVGTMGGSDKKVFSLIARGLNHLYMYAWGPRYIGAEGSNFWSESERAYHEMARGAYAIGPADEIIAHGKRWPRRVALLYNRSHEIWNAAYGGVQNDRLLTFMALTHAHIPTDIILEEDLTDEALSQYKVLYIQGFNLSSRHLAALRRWVEKGGVLVAAAGTAMKDEYDSPVAESEALFGASQQLIGHTEGSWHPQGLPKHEPIDRLSLAASELTKEMSVEVIGVKCALTPTTGRSVGKFADGSCGAVLKSLGRGKTLLLGVTPGHIYKGKSGGSSRYTLDLRPLVTQPAEAVLGPPTVEYPEPQTEICRFEHEKGIAVTLNNFAFFLEPADRPVQLTVHTKRKITEVFSSLQGPLKWQRDGDRVTVDLKAPLTVDTVVLR